MPIEALARRLQSGPRQLFFEKRQAHFAVYVNKHGEFTSCERLEPPAGATKVMLDLPSVVRGNNVIPHLFSDLAKNTFAPMGVAEDPKQRQKRQAHLDGIAECARATADVAALAVAKAFERLTKDPKKFTLPAAVEPTSVLVICYSCEPICQRDKVRAFWVGQQNQRLEGEVLECLVCGQQRPALRRLPQQIRGITGSLQGKAALITAHQATTHSGGRIGALCSPVCAACADTFTKSAQALMDDPRHHLQLGKIDLLVWTEPPDPVLDSELHAILTAPTRVMTWHHSQSLVCVLALSAQQRRAVVRLFDSLPATQFMDNVMRWYKRQQKSDRPYQPWSLGGHRDETLTWRPGLLPALTRARAVSKVPPAATVELLKSLFFGQPLPRAIFDAVLRAQGSTLDAAGRVLANLVLGERMVDPMARRIGALFAFLEDLQRRSVGHGRPLNRTLADKQLRRAANHPKRVLGELLIDAHAHLSKLERNGPSWLRKALDEHLSGLVIPERFTGTAHTDFIMGYWDKVNERLYRQRPDPDNDKPASAEDAAT